MKDGYRGSPNDWSNAGREEMVSINPGLWLRKSGNQGPRVFPILRTILRTKLLSVHYF